jgi:integrase
MARTAEDGKVYQVQFYNLDDILAVGYRANSSKAIALEARSAFWHEIDFENKVWKIPASRMKAERDHVVPLCDEAIEILEKMRELQPLTAELVFQGERGGLISDVTINKTLHAIAPNCTVHGFRSSFRIWGAETTSTPSAVLELALAHVNQNKTEAAYQRSDLFERRRVLMDAWGVYCCSGSNVYQINKQKTA